jgi:hypothetical protein
MRYRLMASYLGASYQAAVGPSDRDVTLFAAPPPPEEHGFSPAPGGIWRRQVQLDQLDALWESRPIGSYHGEPCLVLDDLGDRLHIVYLGMDERRAAQLGYWEVDRGVFEVVVPRYDVTDLAEERHEFPIALLLSALPAASPRALGSGQPAAVGAGSGGNGAAPQGAGGTAGWSAPAGAQQRVRGQLPAAMPAPPAGAGLQQPVTGGYPAPGAGHNGAAQPTPGAPGAVAAQGGGAGQFPGGQQPPGGPAVAGPAGVPAGQFAAVPGQNMTGQNMTGAPGSQQAAGAGLLSAPPMQLPPGGQPATAQPTGQQQFPPLASLPAAPQAAVPGPPASPQPVNGQQAPPAPQAPTTVAAWHGSPSAGGNGTWYFQPAADGGQQNGTTGRYPGGGLTPGGYGQQDQGAAQAPLPNGMPNGFAGMQQYAPPAPVNGYPQASTLPPATAQSPQPGQPAQPGMPPQNGQLPQAALFTQAQAPQPGQAPPGPAYAAPSVPTATAAPAVSPAPQAPPAPFPPPAAPADTGEIALPGASAADGPVTGGPVTGGTAQSAAAPPAAQPAAAYLGSPGASPGPAATQRNAQTGPITAPLAAPPPPAAPHEQDAPPAAPAGTGASGPLPASPAPTPAFPPGQGAHAGLTTGGALSKLTGVVRGRRAARKPRLAMSSIFADLVDMADIPRSAYAVDEEVTGAMCLFKTDGGYEVFSCGEDARTEVRFFEEEESAYFYLFGVLAAEALRNGRLGPRRG